MSEHVTDRIIDLIESRVPTDELRAIETHLQSCTDCSEDLALARQLREEVAQNALQHLPPERIVEIASGQGETPSPPEQRHLSHCGDCTAEIAWARRQPDPESLLPPATAPASVSGRRATLLSPARWSWNPRWVWIGAAAAVALAGVFWNLSSRTPVQPLQPSDLARLARVEPLPVQITRGVTTPGSFEEGRMLGLEAYASGDFAAATIYFQQATALNPADDEVLLYLASAELQTEQAAVAIPRLAQVESRSTVPEIRAEALWLLANAELKRGNSAAAVAALRRLIELQGRHAADARSLVEQIGG